jgi:hypothetical protein
LGAISLDRADATNGAASPHAAAPLKGVQAAHPKFRTDAEQHASPLRQEEAIVFDHPVNQGKKCSCFLIGQIDLIAYTKPGETARPRPITSLGHRYARGWLIDYEALVAANARA